MGGGGGGEHVNAHIVFGYGDRIPSNKSLQQTITGTVTDESGQPMTGVSVVVKGTSKGVITDFDGKFSIDASKGQKLLLSYLGYKNIEVSISDTAVVNVKMEQEATGLEDVVVTALGITRSRKSLTYATQEVKGEELTRIKDANLVNSISGKVAGISINRSSSGLGGSVKVVIRGNSSAGNNAPLYVIDGVPMLNFNAGQPSDLWGQRGEGGDAVSLINPDDVESMTVLKGASAAALYGNQGANGVILINTKSGREGISEIKVGSSTFVNGLPYFVKPQNSYGNSNNGTLAWGEKLKEPFVPAFNKFLQYGLEQISSVSVSSGNAKLRSFASYSNTSAQGIVPTNDMQRNSLTVREIAKFPDGKLEADLSVSYTQQQIKNRPFAGIYYNLFPGLLLTPGDNFDKYKDYQTYNPSTGLYTQNWTIPNDGLQQNPYWIIHNAPAVNESSRLNILASLKYNVRDWLSVKGRLNYGSFSTEDDRKAQAGTSTVFSHPNGYYSLNTSISTQLYTDAIITLNKSFSDFDLTVNVGGALKEDFGKSLGFGSGIQGGLMIPNYFNIGNINSFSGSGLGQNVGTKYQVQSVFGNLTLGFRKYVYLDASIRTDWSSALAFTQHSSITYPSVGLNLVLSELTKMPEWVSLAKVRGSVAQVGNPFPAYLTNPLFSASGGRVYQPSAGPAPESSLKPEMQTSFEVGTDWSLFNNRLNLDLTLYHNITKDQFMYVAAPPSNPLGYTSYGINAGSILNEGVEITLGGTPIKTHSFSWDASANFASFRNIVQELSPDLQKQNGKAIVYLSNDAGSGYAYLLKEGSRFGTLQGKDLERNDQGQVILRKNSVTGALEPAVDPEMKDLGSVFPRFTAGLSNTFTYKSISLNFLIDAKIGGLTMSRSKAAMDYVGNSQETATARDNGGVSGDFVVYDGKTPTGEVVQKTDAGAYYQAALANFGSYGATALATYSNTNVLFREVSLGYRLQFKRGFIKSFNASVVARNLFFLYKEAPFDPNVQSSTGNSFQGIEGYGLPGYRSLGLTLNFTL